MKILTEGEGLMLICIFFLTMLATVFFTRRQEQTKVEFLLAGRTAPWILTAFSMAATWVWAPSMFTAAEKAYTQGLAGVFWFVVPNVLTLVLFAFFANKMRQIRPFGWTFSDYIRETYSNRAHNMFLIESFGLQTCSLAVQLLAGATIFHKVTGLPFLSTTLILVAIPLLYSMARGTHLLEPMENIVKKLLNEGLPVKEISKKIGMSEEEIYRLSKMDRDSFLRIMNSRSQMYNNAMVTIRG